jgi:phosphoribosylformylglycinamidine synthase
MSFGNKIGMNFSHNVKANDLFVENYGSIILEIDDKVELKEAFNGANIFYLDLLLLRKK